MTEQRSNWDGAPVWFKWALHEIGVAEIPGGRSNSRIVEFRAIAKTPSRADDSDLPWCAIFVNAALEASGVPGDRSMGARSFEHAENFIHLDKPALGCVVTFWRKSRNSGLGHVGFYRGETASHVYVLGGNQGDKVSIAPFAKNAATFGLSGFFWPRAVALPAVTGSIPIRTGQPLQQPSAV